MMNINNKPKYLIKTIINCSNILDYFIKAGKPITLSELSENLNLYPSSIYRILNTLKYLNYVEQLSESEKYQLGTKVLELGMAKLSNIGFVEESMPFLSELSKKYNENVYLGVLFEGLVLYLAKVEAVRTVKLNTHLGSRSYFNCTALGKVLISFLPKDEREKIYQDVGFTKCTDNTIIHKKQFEKEINGVRKQGFAIDNEEYEEDTQCIAAPIRDYSKKVIAAISISGPSYRFNVEKQMQLREDVIKYGQKISMHLGYKI